MRCQNGQNQTCDATGNWVNTGTATIQLLRNPNFDTNPISWTESSYGGYPIIGGLPSGFPVGPQTSPYAAWMAGYDYAEDWVYQNVTFPTGATSITLSFYYFILSEDSYYYVVDAMYPYYWDPSVDLELTPIAELSNLDAATSAVWTRYTTQLPLTLAGQTKEFGFVAATDAALLTYFFVDSVSLTATACPATP
jgi:hypothetical protein